MSNAALIAPQTETLRLSREQVWALVTVWVTYGSFYLCRVNIGAAVPGIREQLGINAFQMGLILGALKIGYAFGQLINGQLAERFGLKRIVLVGMFGSAAACLLFAGATQPVAAPVVSAWLPSAADWLTAAVKMAWPGEAMSQMATLLLICWLVNGYCQAGGWPPCVKIMSNWFSPADRGRMMGVIGTSYQLGSALTIFASGALIVAFGTWRAAMVVPAIVFLVSACHTAWRLREEPAAGETRDSQRALAAPSTGGPSVTETLWLTLSNGRVWVLAFGLFGLDIVRYGFLDWAPSHLKEIQGTGIDSAALKTAVFPLCGAAGVLVSGWLTDRFFQSRRAPVIAGMLLMVAAFSATYHQIVVLGFGPTVVWLGATGFFLYGAQILLVGTAAQDFARRHTVAAAAGFIDFMGYMGAFSGDLVTGWLLKNHGWSAATYFWSGAAAVAAVLVTTLWTARPNSQS